MWTILCIIATAAWAVPVGMSLYFDADSCPPSWRPLAVARGRLIVAVEDASIAGITVGTPLGDREDRAHTHGYATTVTLPSKHIAADGCCNGQGAAQGTYPVMNRSMASPSGYPFTQMLLCEFEGPDDGSPVAMGTVAHFSGVAQECPKEWEPVASVAGRILVPSYENGGEIDNSAPPLASGEDRVHTHTFNFGIPTQSVSYEGVDGCCNDSPAAAVTLSVTGTTFNASSGLPYVQLLTCASRQATFNLTVPEGALAFNAFACPPGWTVENAVAGRFLVALPANATGGASYGGPSLPPTDRKSVV